MPSILRLPCVVSNGICNRATGDRSNRATATGPPGAGLRDRTPTTPNAVRCAFAAGTRLRRARTSGGLPGSVVTHAPPVRGRPANVAGPCSPREARRAGRAAGRPTRQGCGESVRGGTSGVRATASVPACGGTRVSARGSPGASSPGGRPADKAREGGIPGVFRPKRNDERRAATRFSRDGSPAERRVGSATGCLAGMDRRPNAAWVSSPVVWPGWIAGRTPLGFHHRLVSLPATVRSFRIAIFQDSCVHRRAGMAVHQTPPVHGEPAGERGPRRWSIRQSGRFRKSGARGHPRGHPRGH